MNKQFVIEIGWNIVKRATLTAFLILMALTLTFILMKAIPGDPFQDEQGIPEEVLKQVRAHWGLEDPLIYQYGRFLRSCVSLDFGPSLKYQEHTVQEIILHGAPLSLQLGLQALLIALPIGAIYGTLMALTQGKKAQYLTTIISSFGVSIPTFVAATSLQFFFAIAIPFLPVARWGGFSHTLLPSLALALGPAFQISRLMKASMIEVLEQPYIWTARMKGLNEWQVLTHHALKNSLLPLLNYIGPMAANILVGSFVVERVFAIPGLGQWFVNSVLNRDYPLIGAMTLLYSVLLLFIHTLVEILQKRMDKRMEMFEHSH